MCIAYNNYCLLLIQPGKRPERYLKWANGFIVVYSIVCRDSYDEAARYLEQLNKHHRLTTSETPTVLVGNKGDLERYRSVQNIAIDDDQFNALLLCCYLFCDAIEYRPIYIYIYIYI